MTDLAWRLLLDAYEQTARLPTMLRPCKRRRDDDGGQLNGRRQTGTQNESTPRALER